MEEDNGVRNLKNTDEARSLLRLIVHLRDELDDLASKLQASGSGSVGATGRERIDAILRARRVRIHLFDKDLFADPAWDMLLELYAAALAAEDMRTTALCGVAAVPVSTALRWIDKLESSGWVERQAPSAERPGRIGLSARGLDAMQRYFALLGQDGWPV